MEFWYLFVGNQLERKDENVTKTHRKDKKPERNAQRKRKFNDKEAHHKKDNT